MLSRQIRVLVALAAATIILMLLVQQHAYVFDQSAFLENRPSHSKGHAVKPDQASASVTLRKHRGSVTVSRQEAVRTASASSSSSSSSSISSSSTSVSEPPAGGETQGQKSEPDANPTATPVLKLHPPSSTAHPGAEYDKNLPFLKSVDWSRFAYVQYVTDFEYLCNSAMAFASLHQLDSKAERVLLYSPLSLEDPGLDEFTQRSQNLLTKLRDEYNVKLVPIDIQHRDGGEMTWANSYTKLLAFNQTQYDRILAFDSDVLVLGSMDELFFMPPCPLALPRAYWLMKGEAPKEVLASHIMVIQPSAVEFSRLQKLIDKAKQDEFDMEIVNKLYINSAAVLPHRKYALLSGEFRSNDHKTYLGSDVEKWDPQVAIDEAKLVHFSDWPVLKPWVDLQDHQGLREKNQPDCKIPEGKGVKNCIEREIWNSLYAEFAARRQEVCGNW